MRVTDDNTHEIFGYLSDVSPVGFKLESQKALKINKEYTLRLELTSEISNQPYITIVARAMWSQPDPITPNEYIEGFHIISISTYDREIFNRIVEIYGKPDS
jgi:hypothetical protein